jgi:hypothetical protein
MDELRLVLWLASALLALVVWFLRRLVVSLDAFKVEMRAAIYGDAETAGLLTRLTLVEEVLRLRRRERA